MLSGVQTRRPGKPGRRVCYTSPRRSGAGSRAKPLSGSKGETLGRVWGGTPSPPPQRETNKRANSPKGYEASGNSALWNRANNSPRRSGTGSRAKPLSGSKGETLGRVWGGTPSPTPQREARKRANSPQGYEASGNSALSRLAHDHPRRSGAGSRAKPLSGSKGETLGRVWGSAPSHAAAARNQQANEQPAGL